MLWDYKVAAKAAQHTGNNILSIDPSHINIRCRERISEAEMTTQGDVGDYWNQQATFARGDRSIDHPPRKSSVVIIVASQT